MAVRRAAWGHATFKALQSRDYRWFWLGRLASSATFQMAGIAQGWLVYQLTGSGFALGWVGAFGSVATLLVSPYGGVISDRVERRQILMLTRAAMTVNILIIALLAITGQLQVWHLAASGLLSGALNAFMMPAQNALMADLVDRPTLLNAVSLTAVGMGLMGIVGASVAGFLIDWLGAGSVYIVIALLYLMAMYTLLKLPLRGAPEGDTRSVWKEMLLGIGYIKDQPVLLALLGLALARVLLAMPHATLLPKYAEDVLGVGASGLGALASASGAGALVSALAVAALGDCRWKGRLLIASGLAMGLGLIGLALAPVTGAAFVLLTLVGVGNNAMMVANQTLVQANCDDLYRGRVMSTYMMMWGLTPLGTIPAGALADAFGVQAVWVGQGLLLVLIFGLIAWRSVRIRRLE
jgi:MFS family permease